MDLHERLSVLISALAETPVSFAEKLGIQRSSVSHLLSARNKPSVDFLEKLLAVYPSVNLSWLIAGLGTMWVRTDVPENGTVLQNEAKPTEDIPETSAQTDMMQAAEKQPFNKENPSKVLLLYADGRFEVFRP